MNINELIEQLCFVDTGAGYFYATDHNTFYMTKSQYDKGDNDDPYLCFKIYKNYIKLTIGKDLKKKEKGLKFSILDSGYEKEPAAVASVISSFTRKYFNSFELKRIK